MTALKQLKHVPKNHKIVIEIPNTIVRKSNHGNHFIIADKLAQLKTS